MTKPGRRSAVPDPCARFVIVGGTGQFLGRSSDPLVGRPRLFHLL